MKEKATSPSCGFPKILHYNEKIKICKLTENSAIMMKSSVSDAHSEQSHDSVLSTGFTSSWRSLRPSESFCHVLQMFNSWLLDSFRGQSCYLVHSKRRLADYLVALCPDLRLRHCLFASHFHHNRLIISPSTINADQIRCSRALTANSSFTRSDASCFCPFLSSL